MYDDFNAADADEFITDIDPLDVFDRQDDENYYDGDDDGQPDEYTEWQGLADAGYGTDEDYGYYDGSGDW